MLSISEAWSLIASVVEPAPAQSTPLANARGLVLAETVLANSDSPPFDKALMDGYALRSHDFQAGTREFRATVEITAGSVSDRPLEAGETAQIMTGAPLPPGADCVVPVERTQRQRDQVRILVDNLHRGMHVAWQAESMRRGETVLPAGVVLGPAQLGALAEMGRASIEAIPAPTLAILATGDELVPFDQLPGPGQIRNSNEIMLTAQAQQAGAKAFPLGAAPDRRELLEAAIRKGLQCDILCLSGGVSAGTRDLVPSVLAAAGVEELFHGCNVKPGRPIYFGQLPAAKAPDGRPHWIFGLPGNPVSSMVCFELFTRTALHRRCGIEPAIPVMTPAALAVRHHSNDARPTFFPAVASRTEDGLIASPLDWKGSFDLQSAARANALIFLDERREYLKGERIRMLPLSLPGSASA